MFLKKKEDPLSHNNDANVYLYVIYSFVLIIITLLRCPAWTAFKITKCAVKDI